MPRAIAPLVTTTTSLPARVAVGDHVADRGRARPRAARRSSSATMLEPSLTTTRAMAPRRLRGIQLEHDAGDLDVVARLEARGLERPDHAHAPQAPLDVGSASSLSRSWRAISRSTRRPRRGTARPRRARPGSRAARPAGRRGARRAPSTSSRSCRRPRSRTGTRRSSSVASSSRPWRVALTR